MNLYRKYMLISPLHQSEGHKKGLVATVRPLRPQVSSLFKSIFLKTINLDSRSKWPLCLCTFPKFKFVFTTKWRKNSEKQFFKTSAIKSIRLWNQQINAYEKIAKNKDLLYQDFHDSTYFNFFKVPRTSYVSTLWPIYCNIGFIHWIASNKCRYWKKYRNRY